jgi:hypothetical protein
MLYVDLFESEAIAKFAYDLTAANLVIFFKSGGVYEYRNVAREVFEAFRAAPSKGQYFQASIRPQFAGRVLAPNEIAAVEANPGPAATHGANVVLVEIARLERAEAAPVFF